MIAKAVVENLDLLLKPLGFTRRKAAWNRQSGPFVEVIEAQVSKAGNSVTVNAGVLDTDAHQMMWGHVATGFVEEPQCTVRARVGELIDGRDRWWLLDDDDVITSLTETIAGEVLPFLERMLSRQAMVQWLTDKEVVKKRYPPPILNLAILHHFLGRTSEACALLAQLTQKAQGGWIARAAEITERLGCHK